MPQNSKARPNYSNCNLSLRRDGVMFSENLLRINSSQKDIFFLEIYSINEPSNYETD